MVDELREGRKGDRILIRAHGETRAFQEAAEHAGLRIEDLTCPFVKRIHTIVSEANEAGNGVLIIGDASHPEVIGIRGWAGNVCVIIETAEDAERFARWLNGDPRPDAAEAEPLPDRWVSVSQTTFIESKRDEIRNILEAACPKRITFRDTICSATRERQEGCREVAEWADCMIVLGDRSSANTKKLYSIAKNVSPAAFFAENCDDLPLQEIAGYDKIGVAAGASTPARIIKEVISAMSEAITENKNLEQVDAVSDFAAEEPEKESVKAEPAQDSKVEQEPKTIAKYPDDANDMESMMDLIEKSLRLPARGEIVEGEVVQVSDKMIVVNLGCKKDGVIPASEMTLEEGKTLSDLFKEGDTVQAKVLKTDDGDGNILLSKKKIEVNENWNEINEALDNKEVVLAKVIREVKGGVIAVYKEISGFIPMSQLSDHYVEKADEFIGKVLECKVSKVDPRRNKAVFSHKAFLEEEKKKKLAEVWENLHVGDIVEGTVKRFTEYGAFVDIGGIDGLLHISEISWGKLKHPQEALTIEEKIPVKILSMNEEKGKISLGLKQNRPEPWSVIDEKYHAGQIIEGKVVQIKEYGAFVELEPGLDGLVHISEIAYKRVANIADELSIGQIVKAEILEIDKERRRISLSIKKALDKVDSEETKTEEAPAEAAPAAEEAAPEAPAEA